MDRYTMLFGTVENGSYSSFGATPGMSDFLAQIGASDPYFVADTVQNILRGFEAMPGYEKEAEDCKPVAVRYAPMHLYKLPGLRSLQQFCVLSVSGEENRFDKRSSVYTATTVISMEDMLQGEGLNYLDQLFGVFDAYGGRWLSDQDMNNIRRGEEALDLDITPAKLSIRDLPDFKTVARVVESIYSGESVIIRLEPNCGFNRRAVELLRQIYSLLQPRLAIETGFASYQEPDGIEKLKRETSIRIFLVPASAKLRQSYEKTIILDLAEKQPQIESTPISLLIEKWAKLDWETQRQPAMNWLFRDTARSFHDPNLFIDRSERFFAAIAKQDEWERSWQSAEKTGNIQDPTALQAEYESNREWLELLPWGEEAFKRTIPAMMGENGLGVSSAKLLAKCFNAKKQKKATSAEDVDALRFAASYGKLDEEQLCNLVWQAQDENYRQLVSEKDAEIKAAKQTAEHALDAEKAQYESLKKTAYNEQKKLEERITQLTLDIERSRTKLAEQKQAIDQVTEERRLAVEQKETTEAELRRVSGVAKEVQKQNEEKDQALRDKQNKLDEAIDFYQKTQSQLNMTQQELRAAKEDLDKKNKDLEKANSDLVIANKNLTELEARLNDSERTITQLVKEKLLALDQIEKAETERNRALAVMDELQREYISEISELHERYAKLKEAIDEKELELERSRQCAENLYAEKKRLELLKAAEKQKLEQSVSRLSCDLNLSHEMLEDQKKALYQAVENRCRAEKQKEKAEAELQKVSASAKEYLQQIEQKDKALRDKNVKLEEAIDFFQATQSQLNMVQQELCAVKQNLAQKNEDLEQTNKALTKVNTNLNDREYAIKLAVEEKLLALKQKEKAEEERNRALAVMERLHRKYISEINGLKERQAELEAEIEKKKLDVCQAVESQCRAEQNNKEAEAELQRVSTAVEYLQLQNKQKDLALRDTQTKLEEAKDYYQKTQNQLNMTQQELRAARQNLDRANQELAKYSQMQNDMNHSVWENNHKRKHYWKRDE